MSGVQTPEQRITELLALRDRIDTELIRLGRPLAPGKKRPRNVIPPCGTETAYQRHRWYGEDKDDACKAAHAQHERVQSIARAAAKAQRPHLRSVS